MTTLAHGDWEKTQIKVFTRWCAKQLGKRQIPFEDVTSEFSNGVKLINLLEIIGKEDLGKKWYPEPKNQYQAVENCDNAIEYMTKKKNIKVVGIGGKDIYDKNLRLTLGLTWTMINKFLVEEITVEEATARDALLLWCKKNTAGYEGVEIKNFSRSWNNGLAFCALVNKFRPQLLDYSSLDFKQAIENCQKAFDAFNTLGITVYLDPEDVCCEQPDDKSIITQVAELFHYFAADSKADAEAQKAKRMITVQKQIEELQCQYVEQAKAALASMEEESAKIADDSYEKTVPGLKGKLIEIMNFGKEGRPHVTELKSTAEATYSALHIKCSSKHRKMPEIEENLLPPALNQRVAELDQQSADTRRTLLQELHGKTANYNEIAAALAAEVDAISAAVTGEIAGDFDAKKEFLTEQENKLNEQNGKLEGLKAQYAELEAAEMHFEVENTPSMLQVSIDAIIGRIQKLRVEIDAVASAEKEGLQLSAEKMEEYKQTFFHFDADQNGQLEYYELRACLTAVGEDVTDDQAKEIITKYSEDGKMTFEMFTKFMEEHFANQDTAESNKEAFRTCAGGAEFITDAQLEQFFPEDAEYLKAHMPQVEGGYDYTKYIEASYE